MQVTSSAVEKALKLLAERGDAAAGVRIGVRGGGCSGLSYFMDFTEAPEEGDQVLRFDGLQVFIDPRSAEVLRETELDYVEGIAQHGFQFRNPQAKSTCGCGISFST